MARVLAFDYGMKRTGIAVTDPLQIIANSLTTVSTTQLWEFIKKYCGEEEVSDFVVGYPYRLNGKENDVIKHIDKFIAKLSEAYPDKPVHKIDERFTSKIASQTLLMSGVNRKERRNKGNVDVISANIILQSYLEMTNR